MFLIYSIQKENEKVNKKKFRRIGKKNACSK